MRSNRRLRSQGFALFAVLVVSMLASMIVISLLYRVRVEQLAANAGSGGRQAWSVAMSGVYHAASVVRSSWSEPGEWLDKPAVFRGQMVADDGRQRWYFTVFTADEQSDDGFRHGVTDESSRLNLHGISDETIAEIPGMNVDRAEILREHLGRSEVVPSFQAAFYESGGAIGGVNAGRIATLDELTTLESFGVDASLFDASGTGRTNTGSARPTDANPWSRTLTTFGVQSSLDRLGRPQIDLNHAVEALALLEFPRQFYEYVAAVRRASETPIAFSHSSALLDARITVKNGNGEETELDSGITVENLDELLDRCTTVPFDRYVGPMVNVNTASAEVLELLPGVDESLAKSIVATRRELDRERRQTTAWVLDKGLVDVDGFKKVAPFLTARGFQYRVQVVGYGVPSGAFRIIEAVVDISEPRTRVVFLKDRTRDGLPFPIAMKSTDGESES
jgi:hypothetical protein